MKKSLIYRLSCVTFVDMFVLRWTELICRQYAADCLHCVSTERSYFSKFFILINKSAWLSWWGWLHPISLVIYNIVPRIRIQFQPHTFYEDWDFQPLVWSYIKGIEKIAVGSIEKIAVGSLSSSSWITCAPNILLHLLKNIWYFGHRYGLQHVTLFNTFYKIIYS